MSAPKSKSRKLGLDEVLLFMVVDLLRRYRHRKQISRHVTLPQRSYAQSSSVFTLDSPSMVPDDKHITFKDEEPHVERQDITAAYRGQSQQPRPRLADTIATQVAKARRNRRLIAGISLLVSFLTFVGVISWCLGYENGYNKEMERLTSTQGLAPMMPSREYFPPPPPQRDEFDSLYKHCDNVEGAGVDQGIVLYDPDNDTCYFGTQIPAHLKEVELREKREQEQLDKASYALGQLAAERGVLADDSWRYLAQEFAATSKLPMALEAGRQAFVEHGGEEDDFSPHIAKGGTPYRSSSVKTPPPPPPPPIGAKNCVLAKTVKGEYWQCSSMINGG